MASIIERGPQQIQVRIRRTNHPLLVETFETMQDAQD